MDEGDQPVTRRRFATGKTVKEKHIDDIWCLVCSIKNSRQVDRVLLKNGKRSLKELDQSRKLVSLTDSAESLSASCSHQQAYECNSYPSTAGTPLMCINSQSDSSGPLPLAPAFPLRAPPIVGPASPEPDIILSTTSPPALTPNSPTNQPSSATSHVAPQSLLTSQEGKFFRSTVMGEI